MIWLILKWRWQGGGERLLICPISSPSPTSEYLVVTCGTPGILSNQNDDDDDDDVDDVDDVDDGYGDDEFDDYDNGNDVDQQATTLFSFCLPWFETYWCTLGDYALVWTKEQKSTVVGMTEP